MATDTKSKGKAKVVTFEALRVQYAKRRDLDVTKASKQLRAKLRNAYGKDDVVTGWFDRHNKEKGDGNRYGDLTATEAKHILEM